MFEDKIQIGTQKYSLSYPTDKTKDGITNILNLSPTEAKQITKITLHDDAFVTNLIRVDNISVLWEHPLLQYTQLTTHKSKLKELTVNLNKATNTIISIHPTTKITNLNQFTYNDNLHLSLTTSSAMNRCEVCNNAIPENTTHICSRAILYHTVTKPEPIKLFTIE